MKRLVQDQVPHPSDGRGTVAGKARRTPQAGSRVRRNEVILEVGEGIFSDDAIQGLVDDWIISMIVEEMIRGLTEGQHDPVLSR